MNVIFFFFYFFILAIIITNILRVSKAFRTNGRMFDNIEDIIRQRYNSMTQTDVTEEKKIVNETYESVDLDGFMKSNSNPIKEVKGKRSKI